MRYHRAQHTIIVELLASMRAAWLLECGCYFAGGTAIVLKFGEYRQSLDVDFLCADTAGYRDLRNAAVQRSAEAFFGLPVTMLRDMRIDQFGIRAMLGWKDQTIRFEIIREARIDIAGALDQQLCVPVLALEDMFAEKLLANSDRCQDRTVAFRDAIDLGMLSLNNNGLIPAESVRKATSAYGEDIALKIRWVLGALADPATVRFAASRLDMDLDQAKDAVAALQTAAIKAWPG